MAEPGPRAAVLVASDGVVGGTREDTSGPLAQELLIALGFDCAAPVVVADDRAEIATRLRRLATDGNSVIVTSGGTGFSQRDVTPEATRDVIEREAPGFAEAIRAGSPAPFGALTRGVAGITGTTIIVNLPGSTGGVRDGLEILADALGHAVALVSDRPTEHPRG